MYKSRNDILNGNITNQIMIFLFPAFIGYLLQQIYTFADSIILGRIVGTTALAGVGATSQLINIFNNFMGGICAAITVLVAQSYGKRSVEGVQKSVKTGFFISVIFGIIMSLIGLLYSKKILTIMNTPQEVMEDALTYTFFYFISFVFYFIYNTGISIFRAQGDSKRPVYFIILLCVIKIGLDLLLAGIFHLGVLGTSIATLVSYVVSCVAILLIFVYTPDIYHYSIIKDFGFDKNVLLDIFKIGFPAGIQSMFFAFTSSYIQAKINPFGTNTVAAFTAYNQIDNFYWCFVNALSAAVMTIVGQNYGNKNIKRVRETVLKSMIIYIGGSLIYGVVFYIFGQQLVGLFTTDLEVAKLGHDMLKVVALTYFLYSGLEIISSTLKACGDATPCMIITLIFICGFRIVFLSVYPMTSSISPILCYPASWIPSSLVSILYFVTNKKYKLKKDIE